MNAAEIANRLNAKRNGSGWTALCPAHADTNASLSISESPDGKILLHCFAGCTPEQIVAAMGLKMSDLFSREHKENSYFVCAYDYVDAENKLLFQVVRFNPKSFKQRRPDGNGGWIWNMDGVQRVLYRLPQVIEAVKTGQMVFVVEGEKDVEALESLGVVATTNPGGAGKWQESYTATLTGAQVVVIADKDTPGRKHAQLVAASLYGKVASLKVLELPDRDGGT